MAAKRRTRTHRARGRPGRRGRLGALAAGLLLLAGFVALFNSDALLFRRPAAAIARLETRIADRYRQHGLVAFWTLDDLAIDEALTGATALNFGSVLTGGRYGRARAFDGSDRTYVTTDVAWPTLGAQYTLSAWVNLARTPATQVILAHRDGEWSGLVLLDGKMTLAVPYETRQMTSYPFTRYGEWVHLAAVVDASQGAATLYEDGIARATMAIGGVDHLRRYVEFGKLTTHKVYYPLHGTLDEVALWKRALTATEVASLARAGHSLGDARFRLAPRSTIQLLALQAFATGAEGVLKLLDYFNPLYHESRIFQADLPVFSLALSRDDLRHLEAAHRARVTRGFAPTIASNRRSVQLVLDGSAHAAEMALYGSDPALWTVPKKAFVLDADVLMARFGARRLLSVPPERRGLLRPLLHRRLAAKQGIPSPASGLGILRINGAFRGLYHFEAHPVDAEPAPRPEAPFPDALARLPRAGVDPVQEYAALRRELEPLLVRDRMSAWSVRRLRYELGRDQRRLHSWVAGAERRGDEDAVREVSRYLEERLMLNGNPAASFVVGDLDLGVIDAPTVRVTWTSSRPSVIDTHGRVVRPPTGGPVGVTLTATITSGRAAAEKALRFTVMPTLTIPALRLGVPGTVRDSHRTPCRVELVEDSPLRRTGWRSCGIKLRGNTALWHHPKPSYSLRTTEPHAFFDFSESRVLYLMASFADASLIRNKVAYDLFRSFGGAADPRYSPKIRLVEVFVNDEYQGVYQLSERVDRHMFPLTVNGEAVIYKAVSKHDVFATLRTDAFVQVEPPADRSAHWEPLAELTGFTSQPRGRVFAEGIGQRIDLPTFADYLILVNLMNHNEGELHNFLLVRAAETEDRFVIVPWDFDKSLGEAHERWRSNFLFDRLLQRVPEFKTMLKTRWVELRRAQLDGAALDARVDWLAQELEASVPREFERWPRAGMPTHRQAIAETKTRLRQRLLFLDRHLARL